MFKENTMLTFFSAHPCSPIKKKRNTQKIPRPPHNEPSPPTLINPSDPPSEHTEPALNSVEPGARKARRRVLQPLPQTATCRALRPRPPALATQKKSSCASAYIYRATPRLQFFHFIVERAADDYTSDPRPRYRRATRSLSGARGR